MENDKLVSVIVPMYNSEKTIKRCLESIIYQKYDNIEIIVVDDCSDDNSIKIATDLLIQKKINYKLITNSINKGAGESRNSAISASSGKYLAFLDSDDFWIKNKLNIQLPILNEFPIVGSNYIVNYKQKEIKVPLSGQFNYKNFLYENYLATSSIIINLEIINKRDVVFKNVVHDDFLLWLDLLKKYNCTVNVSEHYLFVYERRKNSLSAGILNKLYSTYLVYRYHGLYLIPSIYFTIIKLYNSIIKRY